jgi:hypothetical protein
VFLVRYELGFYIPEDDILHSLHLVNLKSCIALTNWVLYWRRNVFPVGTNSIFISKRTAFFIVAAVKTSNLRLH